jgi:hypothetical protein
MKTVTIATTFLALAAANAAAQVNGSVGGPFAGYDNLIDMEADWSGNQQGDPISVPADYYLGSHGVTSTDGNGHAGWTNTGFPGLEQFDMTTLTWDTDIVALQLGVTGWDGPDPFSADWIDVFNDGNFLGSVSAIGQGTGGFDMINIDNSGAGFDEIRIAWFGTDGLGYTHYLNWNAVPTPSSVALLGLGGLVATRRRR